MDESMLLRNRGAWPEHDFDRTGRDGIEERAERRHQPLFRKTLTNALRIHRPAFGFTTAFSKTGPPRDANLGDCPILREETGNIREQAGNVTGENRAGNY
jgi:hypothetical protein